MSKQAKSTMTATQTNESPPIDVEKGDVEKTSNPPTVLEEREGSNNVKEVSRFANTSIGHIVTGYLTRKSLATGDSQHRPRLVAG